MLAQDILNQFDAPRQIVANVILYLGADIFQDKNGKYIHTFAFLPSKRDPQGGIVRLKLDSPLNLEQYTLYHLESESKFDKASSNFGIFAFHLDNIVSIKPISRFTEVGGQ